VNSGLMPLCDISYEYADKGLISAFVERWHQEINSFHLPVGEMTVTLDDVSMLFHLPIIGQFCPNVPIDNVGAMAPLIELLGVDRAKAIAELRQCRGPHVRLSWLRDLYEDYCETEQCEYTARAYLLHLIGCTIFTDKSSTYISVLYLLLFRDLATYGRYAWGVAALVHMYKQLGDACFAYTKQLVGYLTLLQVYINFHFEFLLKVVNEINLHLLLCKVGYMSTSQVWEGRKWWVIMMRLDLRWHVFKQGDKYAP